MKNSLRLAILLLSVTLTATGCFWSRHKAYTFDQKFDYHLSKVMKTVGKAVSDKGKLEKIETKIRSQKPELQALYQNFKNAKKELLKLILEGKAKTDVQKKLSDTGTMKIDAFSKVIDILYEVKAELSEAEWSEIANKFKHDCAHWWN